MLPDDLDAKLRHEAARRQSTVGEVTREAIEIHLWGGAPEADRREGGAKRFA
jgi:hypothetical protein